MGNDAAVDGSRDDSVEVEFIPEKFESVPLSDVVGSHPGKATARRPSQSFNDARARQHPVPIAQESRSDVDADHDFLKSIVQGIRRDVLGDSVDESSSGAGANEPTEAQSVRKDVVQQRTILPVRPSVAAANVSASQTIRKFSPQRWLPRSLDLRTATIGLVAASIAAVAISAWLMSGPKVAVDAAARQTQDVPSDATAPAKPERTFGQTMTIGWSATRDFLARHNPLSSPAGPSIAPSSVTSEEQTPPVRRVRRRAGDDRSAASTTNRPSTSASRGRVAQATANRPESGDAPPAPQTEVSRSAAIPAEVSPSSAAELPQDDVSRIYGAGDLDVTPPTFIAGGLRGPWSPSAENDASFVAVVINEMGIVESARSGSAPGSIGESLKLTSALSSVKASRFTPAMKDGAAVKYRLFLPLSVVTGP